MSRPAKPINHKQRGCQKKRRPEIRAFQFQQYKGRGEEWYKVALKAAKMGTWYWRSANGSENVVVRSEEYDVIMGLDRGKSWTGEDWLKALHPTDREAQIERKNSILTGELEEYDSEFRVVRPCDGAIRWIHSWGRGIRDSSGRVVGLTGVIRDITDQKSLEKTKEQIVAALSHDLRNPLAAAQANAEILKKYGKQSRLPLKDEETMLQKIVSAIGRADRLIQDMLDSSRLEAGHALQLVIERCDLGKIVTETTQDMQQQYSRFIHCEVSTGLEGWWGKEGIRRIIENLITNAIKYGAPRQPVNVSALRAKDWAILTVHNSGNPIPPEQQKTLFEPFYRAAHANEGTQRGWGLGLSVVRGVVDAHHGVVDVQSAPEVGTRFTIRLPIRGNTP